MILALVFATALVASLFSAFVGGGGGLVVVPTLVLLGLPVASAIATSKIGAVFLGIGSTLRYNREKYLDLRLCALSSAAGLPMVVAGAHTIIDIPDRVAEIVLGAVMLTLVVYTHFKKDFGQNHTPHNRDIKGYLRSIPFLLTIGFFSGFIGAGSGLLYTIFSIRWFGLDYKRAVAHTMFLLGIVYNAVGATTFYFIGDIVWLWVPLLIIGYFLGSYIGAHLAVLKGNLWIRRVFEVIAFLIALKLIIG